MVTLAEKREAVQSGKASILKERGFTFIVWDGGRKHISSSDYKSLGGYIKPRNTTDLTKYQAEIVELLKQGLGVVRISDKLNRSPNSVIVSIKGINKKLKLSGGVRELRQHLGCSMGKWTRPDRKRDKNEI